MKKFLRNLFCLCAIALFAIPAQTAKAQAQNEVWYIVGIVNGSNWDKWYPFTQSGSEYTWGGQGNFIAGEFLITKGEGWSPKYGGASVTPNGVNATILSEGSESNVSLNNVSSTQMVNNAQITMTISNNGAPSIKLSGEVVAVSDKNIYAIHGDWYDSGWSSTNMNEENGKWVLKGVTVPTGSFGIKAMNETTLAQTNWYSGSTQNYDIPAEGGTFNCYTSNNHNFTNQAGTYDITFDPTPSTPTITFTPVAQTYPETVYIIGNVNGYAFAEGEGVKQSSVTDYVFKFNNITVAASDGQYGYFSFTGGDLSSWNTINSKRYAPKEKDQLISADETLTDIVYPHEGSWKILAGTYDFTLDVKNLSLSVASASSVEPGPPTPTYPATMYLIGAVNGDNWSKTIAAQGNEGVYTWSGLTIEGGFKIKDVEGNSWEDLEYNIGSQSGDPYVIGTAYTYENNGESKDFIFNPDFEAINNATVTLNMVKETVTVTGDGEERKEPVVLYVRGSWNEWGTTAQMTISESDENVYTWSGNVPAPAEGEDITFKIADDNYSPLYNFGDAGLNVYSNQQNIATLSNNTSNNIVITNWVGGEMQLTFNINSKVLTVVGAGQPEYQVSPTQKFYLIGNFNSWTEEDADYELVQNVDGEYFGTFEMPGGLPYETTKTENTLAFKVFSGDWTTSYGGLSDAGGDMYLAVEANENLATPMIMGTGAKNWVINNWTEDANISFTVNVDEATLTINSSVSGVKGLDKANEGEEMIFNLQGVRVDRNHMGKGIFIINGKKVLVK